MAAAAPLRDLTATTLDLASERAADLRDAGSSALHAVADQVDVDAVGAAVKTHRLRTAIIGLLVIAAIVLLVKKVAGSDDDLSTP
jgi:hypothetical protein